MADFKFHARLFSIDGNSFHFVTTDNVKVIMTVDENMADLWESECLKRKKQKSLIAAPFA